MDIGERALLLTYSACWTRGNSHFGEDSANGSRMRFWKSLFSSSEVLRIYSCYSCTTVNYHSVLNSQRNMLTVKVSSFYNGKQYPQF
ncbi:hypothetical protein TNCV_2372491 [Trichonephila clavipes]|nr:hypothetical protein TNCV_2372491 [Trichonephila clavipes]